MAKNKTAALFEGKRIRRHWDEEKELWHFSVVDVVGVLSGSIDLCNYWKVLKSWVKQEGSEVVTKCNQLKMKATDDKYHLTDAVDMETMLCLIQSIPSPKAEPFKLWLARVGYERLYISHFIKQFIRPEYCFSISHDECFIRFQFTDKIF